MAWMPSYNLVCQTCHVGWGVAVLLAGVVFGHPVYGALVLLAWIAVKEFVFDLIVEQDTFGDSCMDATFYIVGGIFGSGLWWLSRSI